MAGRKPQARSQALVGIAQRKSFVQNRAITERAGVLDITRGKQLAAVPGEGVISTGADVAVVGERLDIACPKNIAFVAMVYRKSRRITKKPMSCSSFNRGSRIRCPAYARIPDNPIYIVVPGNEVVPLLAIIAVDLPYAVKLVAEIETGLLQLVVSFLYITSVVIIDLAVIPLDSPD